MEINQSAAANQNRSKSIKVDNHKKLCDRFLSTSDICRLSSIEFDRQRRLLSTIDMLRPATPNMLLTVKKMPENAICILFV